MVIIGESIEKWTRKEIIRSRENQSIGLSDENRIEIKFIDVM